MFAPQATEWKSRADKFEEMCCSVIHMFTRLSNTANRTILYDLYPYLWDIKSIICMVKSFVQWLGTYEWVHGTLYCVRALVLQHHEHTVIFSDLLHPIIIIIIVIIIEKRPFNY